MRSFRVLAAGLVAVTLWMLAALWSCFRSTRIAAYRIPARGVTRWHQRPVSPPSA